MKRNGDYDIINVLFGIIILSVLSFEINRIPSDIWTQKSTYSPSRCPICKSEDLGMITYKHPHETLTRCLKCGYTARREQFENN